MTRPFISDWTIHPGVFLRRILTERGVSEAKFTVAAGLGPETVHGLIAGTVAVDGVIASRIGRAIEGSGTFWLNAQHEYDAYVARKAIDIEGSWRWASWMLRRVPRAMRLRHWCG